MIRHAFRTRRLARPPRRGGWRFALLAAALIALAGPSAGQSPPAPDAAADTEAPPPAPPADVPASMASPRACLKAFLTRMTDDKKAEAAELLDLSDLTQAAAAAKGPELAYKLYATMRRIVLLPDAQQWPPLDEDEAYENVPNVPDFEGDWSLATLERYADLEAEEIEIARGGDGRWRFSAETVAKIDELFVATGDKLEKAAPPADAKTTREPSVVIEELFPTSLRETHFLLPTYQWFCLLLTGLLGRLADGTTRLSLTAAVDALLRRNDPDFDDTTKTVWKPVGRLANAATWYGGATLIGLPVAVIDVMLNVLLIITILAAVWALWAVISLVAGYFSRRAKRSGRRFDDLVVPLAATTAKVAAGLIGVLSLVAVFNNELPSALLGGLGIGGVALALASQETLSNFFGSVTVLFDRPFEVGDWIVVEGIEGEIESVGFRSTRIRTGPNSQVTLPNSKLAGAAIDNLGRRKFRRYLTRLGLEYGTDPELIEAFCEGIRELIRRHPHTRKDFYAAYFNEFGASSLEVLLVVFFEAPDWATELRERHRLLADIARLAKKLGVEFAFPTQTLHLHRGEGPGRPEPPEDADRTGQRLAAEIAGELPNYQDRPGRVKFPGPTPVDPSTG